MHETFDAVLVDLFGTLVTDRGEAIQGARELLESLPQKRWAIVTSCSRRLAEALLTHAGLGVPEIIVSAEDVERGKPAPDCYLLGAKLLAVPPDRCLVLEDSRQGLAAAAAAGMTAINVRETALRDLAFDWDESDGGLRLRS